MEFVQGQPLFEFVSFSTHPMLEEDVVYIVRQVVLAIRFEIQASFINFLGKTTKYIFEPWGWLP